MSASSLLDRSCFIVSPLEVFWFRMFSMRRNCDPTSARRRWRGVAALATRSARDEIPRRRTSDRLVDDPERERAVRQCSVRVVSVDVDVAHRRDRLTRRLMAALQQLTIRLCDAVDLMREREECSPVLGEYAVPGRRREIRELAERG